MIRHDYSLQIFSKLDFLSQSLLKRSSSRTRAKVVPKKKEKQIYYTIKPLICAEHNSKVPNDNEHPKAFGTAQGTMPIYSFCFIEMERVNLIL